MKERQALAPVLERQPAVHTTCLFCGRYAWDRNVSCLSAVGGSSRDQVGSTVLCVVWVRAITTVSCPGTHLVFVFARVTGAQEAFSSPIGVRSGPSCFHAVVQKRCVVENSSKARLQSSLDYRNMGMELHSTKNYCLLLRHKVSTLA